MKILTSLFVVLASLSLTNNNLTTEEVKPVQDYNYPNNTYVSQKGIYYQITDDEAYVYSAKKTEKTVEIPDTITYTDLNLVEHKIYVTKILAGAFAGNDDVVNVVGFNYIKSIGKDAFASTNITNINTYSSDTKGINFGENLKDIGERAFYNCDNIESVSYDSLNYVDDKAFYDCDNLQTFGDENGIVHIDYDHGEYVFSECDKINTCKINYEYVNIGTFANDKNLFYLYAKGLNYVEERAFYNSSLTTVYDNDIKKIATEAFMNAKLTDFGLGFNLEQVLEIAPRAFMNNNISTLDLGYKKSINEDAFAGNPLVDVYLSNINSYFSTSGIDMENVNLYCYDISVKNDILKYFPNAKIEVLEKNNNLTIVSFGHGNAYALSTSYSDENTKIPLVIYPDKGYNLNIKYSTVINGDLVKENGEYYITNAKDNVKVYLVFSHFVSTVSAVNYDSNTNSYIDPINNYVYKLYTNPNNNLKEAYLYEINDYDKVIVLPDYIMYNDQTYKLSKLIKDTFVNKTVEKIYGNNINIIEEACFENVLSLEEVRFSSLKNIPASCFENTSLKAFNNDENNNIVDLSNIEMVGKSAFKLCDMETLYLGNNDIKEESFLYCDNLRNIYANNSFLKGIQSNSFTQRSEFSKTLYTTYVNMLEDYDLLDNKSDNKFFDFDLQNEIGQLQVDELEHGKILLRYDIYNASGVVVEVIPEEGYTLAPDSIKVNGSTKMDEFLQDDLYLIKNGAKNSNISAVFTSNTDEDVYDNQDNYDKEPPINSTDDEGFVVNNYSYYAVLIVLLVGVTSFLIVRKNKKNN